MFKGKTKDLFKKIKEKEKQIKKDRIEAKKSVIKIQEKVSLPVQNVKEIKEIDQNQFSETRKYFDKVKTEAAIKIYKPDIRVRNPIKIQLNNTKFKKDQINLADKYCTNYIFTEEQNMIELNTIETANSIFNSSVECEIIKTDIIGSHGFVKHIIRIREDKWIRIHAIHQIDLVSEYSPRHFRNVLNFNSWCSNYTGAINQFKSNHLYNDQQYKRYLHKFVRGRNISHLKVKKFWYGGGDYVLETVASEGNSSFIYYDKDGYYLCCELDYWTDTGIILGSDDSELYFNYRQNETIFRSNENVNMHKEGGDLCITIYVHPSGGMFGGYQTQKIFLYKRNITKVTGKLNVTISQ